MIPSNSSVNPLLSASRSILLREFVPRADRVPRDERVDVPEIQESARVNFSDAAWRQPRTSTRCRTEPDIYRSARRDRPTGAVLPRRCQAVIVAFDVWLLGFLSTWRSAVGDLLFSAITWTGVALAAAPSFAPDWRLQATGARSPCRSWPPQSRVTCSS